MEQTFHKIDPDGDTLLILRNANAPFAVLPSPNPSGEQNGSDSALGEDPADQPEDADDKRIVRMQLSSKHLTLASTYFQKLTASGWKENTPEDGYSYIITAHDWDEEALLVLMNIIHGRTTAVPREVDLEMFAKIATLVDYYQCHEAVDFFVDTWFDATSLQYVITSGERDFMLRLVVCLVFSESDYFTPLTKSIIRNHIGPINSLSLPIQQSVLDELNENRENIISNVVFELHSLQRCLAERETCTFECSSIHLGSLVKGMVSMGVTDPLLAPPYPYLSVKLLEQGISEIKDPSWETNCTGLSATPAEQPSSIYHGGYDSFNRKPVANPNCAVTVRTKNIIQTQISTKLSGLIIL